MASVNVKKRGYLGAIDAARRAPKEAVFSSLLVVPKDRDMLTRDNDDSLFKSSLEFLGGNRMKRLVTALALLPLLAACPDDKIKPTDSPLERARERTNTNVDHDTKSPLDNEETNKIKDRTNNNVDK